MGGRLIDADALDDSFRDSIVKCKQWFEEASVLREEESTARAEQAYVTFMECSMRLKKQPTVDAVPVVRCRDCKWAEVDAWWTYCKLGHKEDTTNSIIYTCTHNFYCADGERRTE